MSLQKTIRRMLLLAIILLFPAVPAIAETYDSAVVRNVVDGDTLKVFYEGRKDSIRLIGIDAPESRVNQKALKDAQRSREDIETITSMGKKATQYTKGLVGPGDIIRIEFDVQERDKYRRLLGYVYLADGRMLNEEVIRAGYASPMTYPPNVKYQDRFSRAYREARQNGRGLFRE